MNGGRRPTRDKLTLGVNLNVWIPYPEDFSFTRRLAQESVAAEAVHPRGVGRANDRALREAGEGCRWIEWDPRVVSQRAVCRLQHAQPQSECLAASGEVSELREMVAPPPRPGGRRRSIAPSQEGIELRQHLGYVDEAAE